MWPQSSAFWLRAVLINYWRVLFSSCLKSKKEKEKISVWIHDKMHEDLMQIWVMLFLAVDIALKFWFFWIFKKISEAAVDVKFTWLNLTGLEVLWRVTSADCCLVTCHLYGHSQERTTGQPSKLMYVRGILLAAFWACLEFPFQFFQYSLSVIWHKTKWIIPGLFLSSKWKLNSNSDALWVQGGLTAAGQAITAILTYLPYVNDAVLHWLSGNSGLLSSCMQKGSLECHE